MSKLCPIRIEWNNYNGLLFEVLRVEFQCNKKGFEGALLGISISSTYLIIDFLYFTIEIKSPIY